MTPVPDIASWLARTDPRARVALGLGLCLLTACLQTRAALGVSLVCSLGLCMAGRIPPRFLLRRLIGLNFFLAVLTPFQLLGFDPDPQRFLTWDPDGIDAILVIWLKGHGIILWATALVSTVETGVLGHAMAHLRVPRKLIHLYLFTVRYLRLLRSEHERLQRAARARGFYPRVNRHTYRTIASMAGWLLVRSLDRSERVLAAMKCRGFNGQFYLLDHFHGRASDAVKLAAGLVVMAVLGWLEWS